MSAPYTPAAIRAIRNGATASMLGWSPAFFERACRRHGIDAAAQSAPDNDAGSQTISDAKPKRPEVVRRPGPESIPVPVLLPTDRPSWDFQTGVFACGSAFVVVKGPVRMKMLSALFNSYSVDPFARVSAALMAASAQTSAESVRVTALAISTQLRALGWRIDGRMGRGGGYRLARVNT